MYCPFTGLGLYNGFRGNRWLRNRIKIFKQFVIPSLQAQTCQDFILWMSWRREERNNPIVKEFVEYLKSTSIKNFHTFNGLCFYDDKHPDEEAKERLVNSIHTSMGEVLNNIGECDYILMTIQPSDDLYHKNAVAEIQRILSTTKLQAIGFTKGFMCNYLTKETAEYNPTTNPPFYTIKFPREVFENPQLHCQYTSLKMDVGKYKIGTPCPSHEYVGNCLKYGKMEVRGFLVGCHGYNVSTVFNHPFKGKTVNQEVLKDFGIYDTPLLKIRFSLRKRLLRMLPFHIQKKIRYWIGERFFNYLYNFLRN